MAIEDKFWKIGKGVAANYQTDSVMVMVPDSFIAMAELDNYEAYDQSEYVARMLVIFRRAYCRKIGKGWTHEFIFTLEDKPILEQFLKETLEDLTREIGNEQDPTYLRVYRLMARRLKAALIQLNAFQVGNQMKAVAKGMVAEFKSKG